MSEPLVAWGTTRDSMKVVRSGDMHVIEILLETCEPNEVTLAVMARKAFQGAKDGINMVDNMPPPEIYREYQALKVEIEARKHFFEKITYASPS